MKISKSLIQAMTVALTIGATSVSAQQTAHSKTNLPSNGTTTQKKLKDKTMKKQSDKPFEKKKKSEKYTCLACGKG